MKVSKATSGVEGDPRRQRSGGPRRLRLLAEMAEVTGLTRAMSKAMAPTVVRRRRHDPGQVLVDLAVTIADGGDCLSDLAVLRNQPALFGAVASHADGVTSGERRGRRAARRHTRRTSTGPQRCLVGGPRSHVEGDPLILDFDATLVDSHSEKGGRRSHLQAWVRLPALALLSRRHRGGSGGHSAAGNASPHDAADHVALLELALAQLPVTSDGEDPTVAWPCSCGPTRPGRARVRRSAA